MGIGVPTEEEMSALPDPKPMDATVPFLTDTDPFWLDEPQPAPLKFDENAMDWSYLKPTSLTKEMSDRDGVANWEEGQDGNLPISSTQH